MMIYSCLTQSYSKLLVVAKEEEVVVVANPTRTNCDRAGRRVRHLDQLLKWEEVNPSCVLKMRQKKWTRWFQ